MQIRRLKLINYCGHRNLDATFSPGMNLILGPNGSGKSTLFNAMLYLLTGIDRNVGVKTDNICWLSEPDERSQIEMEFTHGRHSVHAVRSIRPDSFKLSPAGGEQVRGTTACLNWLKTELRINPTQLSDFVFVEQRNIDGFFRMPPAARAEEMAPLFGVTKARQIATAISKKLEKIPPPPVQVNEAELQSNLERQQSEHASISAQLSGLPSSDSLSQIIGQRTADIAAIGALGERRSELEKATRNVTELLGLIATLEAQMTADRVLLDGYEVYLKDFAEQKKQADATLSSWNAWRTTRKMREQQAQVRTELLAEARKRASLPKKPADYVDPTDPEFQQKLQPWEGSKNRLEASLAMLKKLKPGEACPTCGQPAHEIDQQIAELAKYLGEVLASYQPLKDQLTRSQVYEHQRSEARRDRRAFRKRVHDQRTAGKLLATSKEPEANEQQAKQTIDDYALIIKSRDELSNTMPNQATLLRERQKRLTQLNDQVAVLEGQIAKTPQGEVVSLQQELDRAKLALQTRTTWETKLAEVARDVKTTMTSLQNARQANEQYAKVLAATKRLSVLQRVYHPTEAPRMVVYSRLSGMLESMNQTLSLFQTPYRVTADEELNFTALFDTGMTAPDRRLSPGQQVSLAMAMRVALNSTFAAELGMLALDEPTAGLDAHRLEGMPLVLDKLRNLSAENSLQVFFITHDPRVADSFDKVIDLGKISSN